MDHIRLTPVLLACVLTGMAGFAPPLAAQTADAPTVPAEQARPVGTIEAGPSNIRQFAPDEAPATNDFSLPSDPAAFNLRNLFEHLDPDVALWYQHVQTLSNPFFEGRAPGTRGDALAADYIEYYFRQYGLTPAFVASTEQPGGAVADASSSYRQPFDFPSPTPDVKINNALVAVNGTAMKTGDDFVVLGVSGNASITAPVTFVGYGIENGPDDYTSFDENTDLTGRVALLLRYEPLNEAGKSRWAPARFTRNASIATKFRNLVKRGAAGIILVNPPGAVDGATSLESLADSSRFGRRLEIPAFQLTPEAAERILAAGDAEHRDLMTWRKLADNGEARCVDLDDSLQVTLTAALDADDRLHTQNVAGVLRGKGSLADQWIIIGAHMDHVGYGYTGATPGNVGKLHPGADDNASGTAGLLLAAHRLSQAYRSAGDDANLRSIMFVAFGAEEAGLIGSKYFVEHSPVSANDVTLMVNMDMIGRLRQNNLSVQGTGTAEEFEEFLKPHFERSGLKISATPGGRGPSDHTNFYNAGIPILFCFTGLHPEYHQPTDRAYTVNPAGAVQVVELVESIVLDVADNPEKFTYVLTNAGGAGRITGARVRLGIQPAYTAELETGVLVEAVTDGTSAADAGIRAGDVLLSWNGEEITGGQKLFELLGKHDPGDHVRLVVQRDDQVLTLDVTLKARARE